MRVSRFWRVLCVLVFVGSSLCVNEFEYEGNYAENYDNEISQDQQEGETAPCQATDFSRWDKLFIALEDSQMRQNMLLESLEQCSEGMASLKNQVDKLAKGTCQQCLPSLESACRAQSEQARVRLQQGLAELRREEEDREWSLNTTLQELLHSSREGNARLRQLEEGRGHGLAPSGAADRGMERRPTPRPGGLGMKPFPSGQKGQEVTSPLDVATMEMALVAIATELQKVHLQLSRVIDQQQGTSGKGRGDT
ncbi:Pentraxin-related protein PTX3 [Nibea albiflora]|uniref:Pentraxin-related protein PTX3 n=1 Tax=Nibea albiflora TaxID=240163 RepID=A0ACB7FGB7_NIBAL|nr:Pentraxin-related protein PTX3 [Nibea albiflora]